MATPARGVRVAVAIVVMPDGADIPGIGLEEQLRWGERTPRGLIAYGTGGWFRRLRHRPLLFKASAALRASEVVLRHGPRQLSEIAAGRQCGQKPNSARWSIVTSYP